MSHARATVRLDDGTILYGEYSGATDVMLPGLYATDAECTENWRTIYTEAAAAPDLANTVDVLTKDLELHGAVQVLACPPLVK